VSWLGTPNSESSALPFQGQQVLRWPVVAALVLQFLDVQLELVRLVLSLQHLKLLKLPLVALVLVNKCPL
jgi:hypothetical protein